MRRVSEALLRTTLLCVFTILLGASCATHRDAVSMREEIETLQLATDARLSMIERTVGILDSLVREQNQLTMGLRASLGMQTQDQEDRMSTILARQDEINYQLRDLLESFESIQLYGGISAPAPSTPSSAESTSPATAPVASSSSSQTAAPTASPTGAQSGATPSTTTDAEALFQSAVDDIGRGNHALAESRLLTFMIQFPGNELAGDAQYWLGEAAYGQKRYDIAIQEFDKLLTKYQNSSKVPAALLKKGLSQIQMGLISEGRQTLNQLGKSFPDSPEAAEAATALESM